MDVASCLASASLLPLRVVVCAFMFIRPKRFLIVGFLAATGTKLLALTLLEYIRSSSSLNRAKRFTMLDPEELLELLPPDWNLDPLAVLDPVVTPSGPVAERLEEDELEFL